MRYYGEVPTSDRYKDTNLLFTVPYPYYNLWFEKLSFPKSVVIES